MTQELDLAQLRKIAEAATPGPWEARSFDSRPRTPGKYVVCPRKPGDVGRGLTVMMQPLFWDERSEVNADHIAAFDPPTALALIARAEAAEQAVARVEMLRDALDREGGQLGTVVRIQNALDGDTNG